VIHTTYIVEKTIAIMSKRFILILILCILYAPFAQAQGRGLKTFGPKRADNSSEPSGEASSWAEKRVRKKKRALDFRRGVKGSRYTLEEKLQEADKKEESADGSEDKGSDLEGDDMQDKASDGRESENASESSDNIESTVTSETSDNPEPSKNSETSENGDKDQ